MKRDFVLVLVLLLAIVPVWGSCTRVVTETSPATENEALPEIETTQVAIPTTQSKPEPRSASFSVSGFTITPKEVAAGSSVAIEALVTNTGEQPGTYEVTLKIDDTIEDTKKITLEGCANQKLTFKVMKSTAKTYSVSINDQSGTFMVQFAPPSPTTTIQSKPLPPLDAFMKGMAFSDWAWDTMPRPPRIGPLYFPAQADTSLKNLASTGANWISLLVNGTQETFRSTKITRDEYITASDEALQHVIDLAHSLGMRVILHPALFSLPNDPELSWIQIGTGFTNEIQWQEWFASYREFINHYASFAQEVGVDMLYVGSELPNTIQREKDWRQVIKEVRERFDGPISYDSVFWGFPIGEYQRITWWDAVDYISVDCWHSLTNKNDPTVEELKEGFIKTGYVTDLENISNQFKKPIIISEIGYDSLDGTAKDYFGTNRNYWDSNMKGVIDLQEQADCYQAVLEVLWGKPWLKGIFWWQWNAISTQWPVDPHGKPAEEVLKKYYLLRSIK